MLPGAGVFHWFDPSPLNDQLIIIVDYFQCLISLIVATDDCKFIPSTRSKYSSHKILPMKVDELLTHFTPKTGCDVSSANFGSYLALFCLLMDRQFLLFYNSGACSFEV